jgi:uncharacterized RDD family membrane protein YckC
VSRTRTPQQIIRYEAATAAELRGRAAGFTSRSLALAVDCLIVAGVSASLAFLVSAINDVFVGTNSFVTFAGAGVVVVFQFSYWVLSWSLSGRTPAMAVLGLRVIRRDGRTLSIWRSVIRLVVLSTSIVLLVGPVWLLVSRNRRGLHDLACGSSVIYDWS